VLIKIGLRDLPAVTFAGLRYSLAFLCLLPFALTSSRRAALRNLTRKQWLHLIVLGVLLYAVTMAAQYLGLAALPSVTVNLLLSFTSLAVAILGLIFLHEKPAAWQWGGIAIYLVGVGVYFIPLAAAGSQAVGIGIVLIGVLSNAISVLLGRSINQEMESQPLIVTIVSMGFGALALIVAGAVVQGIPHLTWQHWAMIGWLAVVNTAFAFTLWNRTQQKLTAMESSMINSAMLIEIPVLAWLCLGEGVSWRQILGMVLAGAGIIAAQLHARNSRKPS
jgi:drug/metabolite transporter (DMT)-like permease